MKLLFRSFVDNEKNEYTTDVLIKNGMISFQDKTNPCLINIYSEGDKIILKRIGSVSQTLIFKENKKTRTKYSNNEGISLDLEIFTIKAKLLNDGFFFHYDLIMDGKVVSNHKILGKVTK